MSDIINLAKALFEINGQLQYAAGHQNSERQHYAGLADDVSSALALTGLLDDRARIMLIEGYFERSVTIWIAGALSDSAVLIVGRVVARHWPRMEVIYKLACPPCGR